MNILIIYGGQSCEHDISIITACLAKGYFDGNVFSAYFDKQNRCFIVPNDVSPSKHQNLQLRDEVVFCFGKKRIGICRGRRIKRYVDIDVAVNCCHGLCGEDGSIFAICQMLGVPLVGSDMLASGIALDKISTKRTLRSIGMPTVMGKCITRQQYDSGSFGVGNLGFPVIVKPNKLGSSIGVAVCHDKAQLKNALEVAFCYDNQVLCEKALTNFSEVNCSAMRVDNVVLSSDVDSPTTTHDLLTFEDKYLANGKWCRPSVSVEQVVKNSVKIMTEQIYDKLGFQGVIRVDFLVDNTTGRIFVNEINAIPGSLAYGLWSNVYSQKQFGDILLKQALTDHEKDLQLVRSYQSSVLSGAINKK